MSKEDMVRVYVKGKVYSKYPGITQIRLGKKAKGYTIACLYTGAWVFFASYVGTNTYDFFSNIKKSNDIVNEQTQLWLDYRSGIITNEEYKDSLTILYNENNDYRNKSISSIEKALIGLGITAVTVIAVHIFDHYDSKKEFNNYFEKNKMKFDLTVDRDNKLITAVQFSF
jgi:hypothetical protein